MNEEPDRPGGEPEDPPPDLGRRAVRGAAVTVTAQGTRILIQMTSVIVLARLISPGQYGLIAMVTAIVGVADIFRDFGLSAAAIQARRLSRDEQSNLFWVNTGLGSGLGLIAIAASPLVAMLYGRDELMAITMALAVNFLLNGMATQYRADLNRSMRFTRLAIADVLAPLTALGIAIGLALAGFGYWALVAQQITQVGMMLVLVVVGAGWLPRTWRRGVSVRRFMSFGWRLAGSQIVAYIGSNVDSVVLGLRVGAEGLGLYNRAYQLIMTPLGQIRGPLNTVAIPVLAKIQDQQARFESYVARGQMVLGYSLVAGLFVVAGAAEPLVRVLLGPDWISATDVIRFLAIGAGFQTLSYVGYWVYVTKGIVDHLLGYTIFATIVRVVLVIVGSNFGLIGVAAAMGAVPVLLWPVSLWWLSRRAAIPVRQLWLGGIRVSVFTILVGAATFGTVSATAGLGSPLQLLCGALAAVGSYAALGFGIPLFRRDLRSVLDLAKNIRR